MISYSYEIYCKLFGCSIELSLSKANKSKQILAKVLYEYMFQNIVNILNEDNLNYSALMHLRMLDIAGFGESLMFLFFSAKKSI